jgi:hypothetical protein
VQGEKPVVRMAPGAVDAGLSEVDTAGGTSDPALVRLGLAVARGLRLDLVATDDEIVDLRTELETLDEEMMAKAHQLGEVDRGIRALGVDNLGARHAGRWQAGDGRQ